MSKATFGQALQALNLIHAKDPTAERLTALYNSGILADVLDADLSKVERDAVRAALKLGSIFTRNEHGHVVVTFTGLDITGAEEIARLEAGGDRSAVSDRPRPRKGHRARFRADNRSPAETRREVRLWQGARRTYPANPRDHLGQADGRNGDLVHRSPP